MGVWCQFTPAPPPGGGRGSLLCSHWLCDQVDLIAGRTFVRRRPASPASWFGGGFWLQRRQPLPQLLLTSLPSCFRPPSMQAQLGAGFPAPTAMGRQGSRGQGLGGRATSRQVRGEEGGRQMVMKEKLKGSSFHKYIFFFFNEKATIRKMPGGWGQAGLPGGEDRRFSVLDYSPLCLPGRRLVLL